MISALALFNALLLSYSRIPFRARVRRLAAVEPGGSSDQRGTPGTAVIVSAICYSIFVLVPFGKTRYRRCAPLFVSAFWADSPRPVICVRPVFCTEVF